MQILFLVGNTILKNYHTKNGKLSTQGQQIIDGIQDATMSNLMKKSNGRWNGKIL